MLKNRPSTTGTVCLLLALIMTIGLCTKLSGQDKLQNAQKKYEMTLAKTTKSDASSAKETTFADHSPGHLAFLFMAGAIAISAMILPGISGAFILLLFGVYFEILEAISNRDLVIIGVVAIGCCLGILVFTRFLNFVLAKYHDQTVMVLVGLMTGSLAGLWPFQAFELVGSKRIDLAPIIPTIDGNFYWTLVSFIAAGALVLSFLKLDKKNN